MLKNPHIHQLLLHTLLVSLLTVVVHARGEEGFYLALHPQIEKKIVSSGLADSIYDINSVVPFKKKRNDYLFVNASLITEGGFEGIWRGNLLLKKGIEECWSEVQIFHPYETFDLSLVSYYTEEEILDMMVESFEEDFLRLDAATSKLKHSIEGQSDLVKKKAYLLHRFRKGETLDLKEYNEGFQPVEMDARKVGLESIFPN